MYCKFVPSDILTTFCAGYHTKRKDTEITNCRKKLIPKYFCQNPNTVKFDALFNLKNRKLLFNICKFIEVIMERVSSPG